MITGQLRLDPSVEPRWRYRGTLDLPSGRYVSLRARVAEDRVGKFFELEAGLEPGMTSAELEALLVECEQAAAERIRLAGIGVADTPSDELPF